MCSLRVSFLMVAGLLVLFATGCSKNDIESVNTKAVAVAQKASPTPVNAAPVQVAVEPPPPVPVPSVPEVNKVADPGCEEPCAKMGYCLMKNGECHVGRVEHCRQSKLCGDSGKCSIQTENNDDGTTFYICTALTDADCKDAETCKQKGACKALDGFCTNPEDESTKKYRAEKIRDVRKMLYDVAKNCDQVKGEALAIYKTAGYPPYESWHRLVKDPEMNRQLTLLKLTNMDNFRAVDSQIEGDADLLGSACVQSLSDATKKAENDCLYNEKRQNLKWIRSAGKADCDVSPAAGGGTK